MKTFRILFYKLEDKKDKRNPGINWLDSFNFKMLYRCSTL